MVDSSNAVFTAHLTTNLGGNTHYAFNDAVGGLANSHLKYHPDRCYVWDDEIETADRIVQTFFEDGLRWDRDDIAAALHDTTKCSQAVRWCVGDILAEHYTQCPYKTGLLWSYTAASHRYTAPTVDQKNERIAAE
jgi:hypothetical protein